MVFVQEVTEWKDNTPNHIYLLNDSKQKMIGYSTDGVTLKVFVDPITFDSRYRKFKPAKNTFGYTEKKDAGVTSWEVTGSKGAKYTVALEDGKLVCTCAGFQFRSKCKHVDDIRNKHV